MKQTNLLISYDLDVVSFFNGNTVSTIEVIATCEDGEINHVFEFYNKHGLVTHDNIQDFLNDADFSELDKKINKLVLGEISKELAQICIDKSTNDVYCTFDVMSLGGVKASVYEMPLVDGIIDSVKGCNDSYHAYTEQEARELIYTLKNKK